MIEGGDVLTLQKNSHTFAAWIANAAEALSGSQGLPVHCTISALYQNQRSLPPILRGVGVAFETHEKKICILEEKSPPLPMPAAVFLLLLRGY